MTITKDSAMPDAARTVLEEVLRDDLQIDTTRVTRDSHLIDEVGLDSVAFAVGMVAIEEKLGVVLTEEELLGCNTVGDLEDLLCAKTPSASN
ncbi:acyl carrier protein [Aldersonia sp. NBC_00410]|uniref:acyl carrier protein n=1 Tax=Aldersonia sp. NBC_00410 TaxID=2975954 RepID=UPI002258A68E|nr:acyl carrier protein [Aldersonia sp. NBC_00410]MCX5042649.1 acyl carrier protein [Aldersonia sp. NBC_00410]